MMGTLAVYMLALCFLSVSSASAFSWVKSRPSAPDSSVQGYETRNAAVLNDLASNGLGPDEVETLFLQTDALEGYSRKPDCFRRAARLVRGRCAEADMDENERVKAAIALTLCEVSTARHHSVPMECMTFGTDSESATESRPEDCVEALSRSAQFWSSYSGYLREVPQLCYAFRRWNDIDTAKDIYRNATLEKLSLIRLLVNREKFMGQSQAQWEVLRQDMSIMLDNLRESTIGFDDASRGVLGTMKDAFQDKMTTLHATLLDVEARLQTGTARYTLQMEAAVDTLTEKHSLALSESVRSLDYALSSTLDQAFLSLRASTEEIHALSRETRDLWYSMSSDFNSMQQAIGRLSHLAVEATQHLDAQAHQVTITNQRQIEATHSVEELSQAIRMLTDSAHTELGRINDTALTLRDSLRVVNANWLDSMLVPLMKMVFHIDQTYLENLSRLPMIRISFALLRVVYHLSQSLLSSVMSVLLIILSFKRLLFGRGFFGRLFGQYGSCSTGLPETGANTKTSDLLFDSLVQPVPSSLASPTQVPLYRSCPSPDHVRPRRRPRLSRIPSRLYSASYPSD